MALPPGFVLEQPKVNLPPGFVLETTPEAPPEKQSFMRQVADVPLGVAKGAVQGIRMIADAFGAGSETSNTIKGAEEYLAGLMSAEAKKDQAEIARIMKDAEDKGVLDQVKAGLQAFATAPVDTLSQALGTAAPVIVGTLGAKILGAGALVSTGLGVATGAGMGAGVVKGSIYEETKKALIEAGADPKVAEQKAQQAQEYGGKNLDQILLGTVLGGVAAAGPLEKGGAAILARRILGKAGVEEAGEATAEAAAKGALRRRAEAGALEAVPEAVQAGQEQVAQNIALQREGFDVPTMRGVAGAATLEGLAGAGLGATVGGGKPEVAPPPVETPPPAPPPAPATALEFKPEPYIQFPDGTVGKRSEVEAYIKTLPEDQQMAMRAKLLGLAPQEAEKEPEPPAKALEFKPEPLIVYPDGSVAKRSEVDAYIDGLPEDEQIPARAKLLGMGEEATQITPEMLRKLGIRGRAPIIQRLSGLKLSDPKIREELTSFAQQPFASPEVRGNIFGFLNTIKTEPSAAPPVAEAAPLVSEAPLTTPAAPTPPFQPAPPAPPVEPPTAEPAAPVVAAPAAPAPEPVAPVVAAPVAAPAPKPAPAPIAASAPAVVTPAPKAPAVPVVEAPVAIAEPEKAQPIIEPKVIIPEPSSIVKQTEKKPESGFRWATPQEKNSDNAKFVYDVGNGARLLFVPSNGDVYVAPPGKNSQLIVRTGDNRENIIKSVDEFPDYIPKNIRQAIFDYHKAVRGKKTDEEQTAVAIEMADKIDALTTSETENVVTAPAPKVKAPAEKEAGASTTSKTDFLYSIDPTIKTDRIPSYKRGVETLRKRWEKGELTSDEFAARVDILAKQIEMAELAKEKAGRERGADFLRQRLLEAKRRGELSPEAVDFAEWFILKNPALVDDLGISIRTPKEDGVGGMYSSYGRVMYLMKERGSDQTVVHEILHHLERMMPKDVQSAIRKAWVKSLMQAQRNAKTDAEKQFFKNLTDFHFGSGSRSLLKAAIDAIKDGDISKDFYQYTSPSEFWAENGSEIMKGRFDVKGSLLGKLKQWISELKEKARDLFGLDNKAAIIRALDSLSKGDGKFVTSTLLDETTEPKLSVTGKPSLKEKIIDAGREAGQKRKLDTGAFEGVDAELVKSLEPTFAPRNVTVQDRILGMRDNFWQRMAQGIADQYRTIKEYSEEAYMKARLSKTVDGGLEGLMFYGQVFNDGGALNIKQNTRGMFDVLKPVGKELDRYLIWVALNREASLPDAKRSINPDLVARRNELSDGNISGKSRKEVYEQVQRDMNALNRSVLKVALDAGLLNTTEGAIKDIEANEKLSPDEKREKIAELRKNPIGYERFINDLNYIPFYRVMEDGDTDSVQKAVSATGLTSQYFSKALKGGEKPFGDLMENTLRNWNHILSASMKNQAAVATIDAAVKAGAAKPNLKPGLEMRDGKVYSIMSDEIVGDGSVRPELTEAGKGTVKVVVDGKNAYYEVTDPLLLDSITSIGYLGPQSKFLDIARDFKNILQFGVTISPQFKVNNLIRDSVSAMGVSELKKNPIANVLEGVSLSDRNSPTYIAAMAGGAIFNFGTAYEGDQSKLIKRLLKMGVDRDHILDSKDKITAGLRYAWDKYQEWGNKSEAANRLALYKQLRDDGMSHLEASFKARDLLDFSMQGSWPAFRVLTQVIPFLNARVQGLYKLGRDGIIPTARVINNSVTGKPTDATDRQKAQQFMIVSSAVMLASALLYLTFKDDEEYKRRDEWDKDNFWWFRLPGMDFALRIPKPFEIGALGTLVERTLEQIYDSGAEGKQFTDAVKRTLGSTFALNPIPQMFKPLVDIYANKDAFTGAPIESAGLERLSKQERMINTTSPLAIALGKVSTLFPEAMELSPVQADYLIKGYFGWLGATAATTSMYATLPFNEGEYPDARWMDRLSLGLARELPGRGAKYVTAFYESNKEISQAFADMRHYAEMGDSEKVQQILEEKGDKIQLAKFYDKTAKTMANIRKQVRVVQNDKDMDGAAKKEEIDRLNDLISTLAKQAEEVRKSMKQN